MSNESYRTLSRPSEEVLLKDRKSKFYGYAFPVSNEEEIKTCLEAIRKRHPTANHVCYAWQLGEEIKNYRANDDGEPNNSAGMPIYGQIQSFNLTNTLVVVVRIFGGIKLGVSGLIQAYRETAKQALENSKIVEKSIKVKINISCGYEEMNKVMGLIKKYDAKILEQKLEMDCEIQIEISKRVKENLLSAFDRHHRILLQILD